MRTTLNQIRAHLPCHDGWSKLLRGLNKTQPDDEIIWIDQILDINGVEDAIWCLRAVEGCDREIRLFAVWCARRVQHLLADPRSVAALDVAERHARGEASDEELASAVVAARASAEASVEAWAAAAAATAAVVKSVDAAAWAWAAAVAVRDTERAAQADELRRICREMREAQS
jgi:hypothetical protein